MVAGVRMLSQGLSDSILLIADRSNTQANWRSLAKSYDLSLSVDIESSNRQDGISATIQYLQQPKRAATLRDLASSKRWFIVADNTGHAPRSIGQVVDKLLAWNPANRALFVAHQFSGELPEEVEARFPSQSLFYRDVPAFRTTNIQIARYAPSFSLLQQFQREPATLDQLSWREFEKLIAGLLEQDGYTVELMQGSKDGGVDIVASKDLGPHGYFKALWQAKKKGLGNKVGISVVRELADTRDQLGASKGIIVTSSYLTRGAIERIDRDKFMLGKVDRSDLNAWIGRTLRYGSN